MTSAVDQSHIGTADGSTDVTSTGESATGPRDWDSRLAGRTQTLGGGEITAILALAGASDVITFSGGFPDPATFPTGVLSEIATRVITGDPGVALQYSATEGIARVRDYVAGRLARIEGQAPGAGELMITSGGIDCMELVAKSYVDAGDVVVVEAPTYLGAIMAFRGYEADVRGVPVDADGLRVDLLAEQLAAGLRPKILYTIPDFQNPTGLTMSEPRRRELVALARRYGFLILEDVAYSELGFDHAPPPSLWSMAPDVVLQAGTFSKIFCPGVRMGWAAGPARDHQPAGGGQAELRPVLGRARAADAGRVRALRADGAAAGRLPRAVRAAGAADGAGADRAHARRHDVDHAAGRLLHLADRAGRRRHGGPGRSGQGAEGRLRTRTAFLSGRRRDDADPAGLQPGRR